MNIVRTEKVLNAGHKMRGMATKTRKEFEQYVYDRWVEKLIEYANFQYDTQLKNARMSTFYRYLKEGVKRYHG